MSDLDLLNDYPATRAGLKSAHDAASKAYAAFLEKRDQWVKAGADPNSPMAEELLKLQEAYQASAFRAEDLERKLGMPSHQDRLRGFESALSGSASIGSGGSASGRIDLASQFHEFISANPDALNAKQGNKQLQGSLVEVALARPVGGYRAALDGGNLGAHTRNATYFSELPRRRLHVLDLCGLSTYVGGLGGEKVQYFKQTVRANNAAATAPLGEKPTSVITISREETEMWTYAHISEVVPNQFLRAVGDLQSLMELDMAEGVLEAFEADILSGAGSTTVEGLTVISGTLTQESTGDPIADIRKALTQLYSANVVPNGMVLNPSDAETLDLQTDAQGMYLTGGPLSDSIPTLWRVPIVISTGLAAGTIIMGDFARGIVRWHGDTLVEWGRLSDDFKYNQVRLLAEASLSAAIARPGNFVKIAIA